ncbi:hypothetical protein PSN45_003429 [Yamadazyma tenuis]|uniref:FAR-17a/AIG1-like protein n=1 Tax=Candida tenuis (strain ATCC 10573 / BCRC 21748 / CBS 615 / JCM 9827 / NBRC 10315 / NRRL Y-1498 / VKM Y-70) TaxID=590646 RepID=G3AY66_CANTC|nr:uncharacterized protein CANTEDRAFT_112647 [Yamadazyma tenuis ATCC 10573]XP_006684749.1 uncharacterized protein CANTEDRAFT_112647 [Yamadazyma tenuis ATCC 10573]EGV66174.1 hypothetical protein CANTEDRAFT_112647 [Yamadazyma tenuis ATCC 10573]EGV66175.1 hypothetical protein CANTEDRAFT_112647 [Yamadazyma tenuis ATCC 10573]WEJ95898.1 hypothetical protein PSN45_003429 [Yamadazyma tenuis]
MSSDTRNINRRTVGNRVILAIDVISTAIGLYGLYEISLIELPAPLRGAGKWQFLTNLSLLFSILTFSVGIISHLTRSEAIFQLKNFLHVISFVAEAVVTSVYWPLRLFFLHYLVNDGNIRIKLTVDLAIHFMPFVSLAIDFFFFMPNFTIKTRSAFLLFISLTSAYWFWLNSIIDLERGGIFPYAFLNIGNNLTRLIIFWVIGFSAFLQFLLMRFLYNSFVGVSAIKQKIQ